MLSIFDRRFQRLAVAAALVAALGLAGCGRKGGLDPPPSAGSAAVPMTDDGQFLPARSADPNDPGAPATRAVPQRPAQKREPSVFDWLID